MLLASATVLVAACGATVSPVPTAVAARPPHLVVLGLEAARSSIGLVDGDSVRQVEPPGADVQWLAADGQGGILATMADGSIARTTGRLPGDPRWRTEAVPAGIPRDPPLSFAVGAPSGDGIAALSAAYGTGKPSSLAILGAG